MNYEKNRNVNNEIANIKKYGLLSFLIIVFVFLMLCSAYYLRFGKILNLPLTTDPTDWGSFGDYIGGILNPFIALFAFYWLTSSIRTQVKELTDSREQFENISNKQQEQIATQNFENLFFQLLNTKQKEIEHILVGNSGKLLSSSARKIGYKAVTDHISKMISDEGKAIVCGKESIKLHIIFFKKFSAQTWQLFYKDNLLDYLGSYFRVCYQIVKLIDDNEILKSYDKVNGKNYTCQQKKYFDIFRATLSQYELEAFFFNCLCDYGRFKFKSKLESYGLFEPLLIDYKDNKLFRHPTTRYAYMYDPNIFEKNVDFQIYFESLNCLNNLERKKLIEDFYSLLIEDIIFVRDGEFDSSLKIFERFEQVFSKLIFKFTPREELYENNSLEEYIDILIRQLNEAILGYGDESTQEELKHVSEFKSDDPKNELEIHVANKLNDSKLEQVEINRKKLKKYNNLTYLSEIEIIIKNGIVFDEYQKFLLES